MALLVQSSSAASAVLTAGTGAGSGNRGGRGKGASGVSQTRLQPQVEEAEARRRSELLSPAGARGAQAGKEGKPLLEGAEAARARGQSRGGRELRRPTRGVNPAGHAASSAHFFSFVHPFHFGHAESALQHTAFLQAYLTAA